MRLYRADCIIMQNRPTDRVDTLCSHGLKGMAVFMTTALFSPNAPHARIQAVSMQAPLTSVMESLTDCTAWTFI